ncbi:MAG: NUDIX domain-containing protein [Candidatus Kerfeldbacteria bacterium]|nr:NUDIX domain-containing protein [Candidatus Kerfeldbacteria bacterium]
MSKVKGYFKFCPRCGRRLTRRRDWRNEPIRWSCPTKHFSFYNNPVTANEALIIRGQRLLMVIRAAKPKKGFLDLPGGFIEGFEDPTRSVVREIKEELGVRFTPQQLLVAHADPYRWHGRNIPVTILTYVGSIRGTPRQSGEVARVLWVPLSRLPTKRLAFPHLRASFRALKRYLRSR